MTNRDDWQPPTAGATPPPPPPGAGPEAPLTANEPSGSRGGRGKLITLVVGVAVLVAAGVFALTRLVGDDSDGGADTAEDAGLSLLSALENEDILGMVDVLVPKGHGESAVQDLIRQQQRVPHSYLAMNSVRRIGQPVSHDELMGITEVWVDTALALGDKSLRTMERIVRAQTRRASSEAA